MGSWGVGRGHGVFMFSPSRHPPSTSLCSTTQKLFKLRHSGVLWKFYYIGLIESSIIGDWLQSLQSPSFPRGLGWEHWKFQPSDHMIVSSGNQPPSRSIQRSTEICLISRNPCVVEKGLVMTNERCPCHPGNSKGFRSSVSGTGDKVQKCISSCIVISFPQEKRYHVLLHSLNHLNKSRPAGSTPGSVHSVHQSRLISHHFPIDALWSGDTKSHSVFQTRSTPSGIQKFISLS